MQNSLVAQGMQSFLKDIRIGQSVNSFTMQGYLVHFIVLGGYLEEISRILKVDTYTEEEESM